ncbi:MAG: Hsp20/alpha crystallin family protein [Gammaproteobacteria bacterium]|jgi:HSP20 family molecular chaperone IbpA
MSEKQDVTRRESTGAQSRSEPEIVLRPPVDIYEDDEGITLHADMPGVTREDLEIRVDNDTLLIEGDSPIELPEGMQPLYADVRSTRYRREFGLSGELDTDAIDASLNDGVLTLRIPKRAEVRPRKIEVRTG